jgi:hypothetical protein
MYDVLYEGGEGDMMKAGSELRNVNDATVGVGTANATQKKKSSIGWNAGAFADEGEEVGDANDNNEVDDADGVVASVPPPKVSTTVTPCTFSPMVGDRVEARDFVTKSWKAARVVGMDEELKTWDLRFEDSTEARGVPLTLLRERKRKKRSKGASSYSSSSSPPSSSANAPVSVVPSNNGVDEIVALCGGLSEREIGFIVDMIKGLKQLSS